VGSEELGTRGRNWFSVFRFWLAMQPSLAHVRRFGTASVVMDARQSGRLGNGAYWKRYERFCVQAHTFSNIRCRVRIAGKETRSTRGYV
jgi:hypothetical protein